MTRGELKQSLNMTLTNYSKAFDENIAVLWEGLFNGFDAEFFRAACLKVIASNKFFPNASEIIDAYQQIKDDFEHERHERMKANQRLLSAQQGYCYLCDNSGYCIFFEQGYEYAARCICAHGQDLKTFSVANIKRDYLPELKDHYTEREKSAIKRKRNPFYRPTIQEALGDNFTIYDARQKERYMSRSHLSDEDKAAVIRKLQMLRQSREDARTCQMQLET